MNLVTQTRELGMLHTTRYSQLRRWNMLAVYFTVIFLIWIFLGCSNSIAQLYHQKHPPSVNLVLATTSSNDYSWTENLSLQNYKVVPYIVDDQHAQYRTPANQGNEAMGYLTYMYEFYDDLPDISIFLHGQDAAWHVDGALKYSTANTLNRLDLSEVRRRKYMNLRISWDNACPKWMNTSITIDSPEFSTKLKGEEPYMKDAFEALFPGVPVPEILAAPCCSQFAVTRETIRSIPRERHQNAMSWLQNGRLLSVMSGRIWEHLWQWLFLKKAVDCPSEHVALCRNYHICFESRGDWEQWKTLEKMRYEFQEFRDALLGSGMHRENRQVVMLGDRIEALEVRIEPWQERAILTGASEVRRREIAGN